MATPTTEADDTRPPSVELAVEDLAVTTGRSPGDISVVVYEPVTWRDGSIGCPVPGRSYTQALVSGYRIELELDGVSYWYHGARDGNPFFCADPVDPVDGGSGDI